MSSGHSEREHAKLSASGSSRWLACPGSVNLEERFPDTSSIFADEGTIAHELAELKLRLGIGEITKPQYNAQLKEKLAKEEETGEAHFATYYSQEMEDHVQTYVDLVVEKINTKTPDVIVLLEERLDFSQWVPPDNFGTGDVVIIAEGEMDVIDLKYGKRFVSAVNNSQMRLYGLGAWNEFNFLYGIENIHMTLVQPRLDNVSTETLSTDELIHWAETVVRPAAEKTGLEKPPFQAGTHCKYCKANPTCKTLADSNLEMDKYESKSADLLSIEEIADILAKADELQKWTSGIQTYAREQALNHSVHFPGWKLVSGKSNRKYIDEKAVMDTLIGEGYAKEEISQRKMVGIGALEKKVGKKRIPELLGDLIVKPEGKPALVVQDDPRPALSSLSKIEEEFA